MKKLLLIGAAALALGLSACGGKSEADKQQIQEARQAAGEMLDNVSRNGSTPPSAPQAADSIAQK